MQAATLHVEIMHLASLPPAQPCLIGKPAQVQKEKKFAQLSVSHRRLRLARQERQERQETQETQERSHIPSMMMDTDGDAIGQEVSRLSGQGLLEEIASVAAQKCFEVAAMLVARKVRTGLKLWL
jgi:hypothetical protein